MKLTTSEIQKVVAIAALYLVDCKPGQMEAFRTQFASRLRLQTMRDAFDELLAGYKLPSLHAAEVFGLRQKLHMLFDDPITFEGPPIVVVPVPGDPIAHCSVEVVLPEATLTGKVYVAHSATKPPVRWEPLLIKQSDTGVAWVLGRDATITEAEARIRLIAMESEFWMSKKGLALRRSGPATFANFMEGVPAARLTARGLRRHYTQPGTITEVNPC